MKVDRENLKLFIRDLRITAVADEFELTDEILVRQLANYFETDEKAFQKPNKKFKISWEDDTKGEPFNYD